MYIQTTNPALKQLYREDIMGEDYQPPGITFHDNGTAQVTQEVGLALVEEYESITPRDTSD